MNNIDRGMIKWMPFNSVISSKQVIQEILLEKNKITMPDLSLEQKDTIQNKIINAFYQKEKVTIVYFYSGKEYYLVDYIKKIDSTYHKIYFNSTILHFEQIINVI